MTDRQTKAERKIATANEVARRETDTPWMTWRDVPLLILFSPFALLFGMHIAGLAMLIRKYLRVPYFVTLTLLYVLLLDSCVDLVRRTHVDSARRINARFAVFIHSTAD